MNRPTAPQPLTLIFAEPPANDQPAPSLGASANRTAGMILAGVAAGCVIAQLIGWVSGLPGIRVVFGL